MENKVIAEFSANNYRVQLIMHNNGKDGYTVFFRDMLCFKDDDIDCFNHLHNALARYMYITNNMLINIKSCAGKDESLPW